MNACSDVILRAHTILLVYMCIFTVYRSSGGKPSKVGSEVRGLGFSPGSEFHYCLILRKNLPLILSLMDHVSVYH
jgi:hypothetical protein